MGQSDGELEEIGLENKGQENTCPKDAANRFKLCFVYIVWICPHKRALSLHKGAQDETVNSSWTSHTNISDLCLIAMRQLETAKLTSCVASPGL